MQIQIRPEEQADIPKVQQVIREAFKQSEFGLQGEDVLVERLRNSDAFRPALSLVAVTDTIVGHVLLTEVILRDVSSDVLALALAPLSVLPEYQGKGIGSQLITAAHQKAFGYDYSCIVLLGHEKYYPRFGYVPAHHFNVHFPFDVPLQNCMLFALREQSMHFADAKVIYPLEFQVDT